MGGLARNYIILLYPRNRRRSARERDLANPAPLSQAHFMRRSCRQACPAAGAQPDQLVDGLHYPIRPIQLDIVSAAVDELVSARVKALRRFSLQRHHELPKAPNLPRRSRVLDSTIVGMELGALVYSTWRPAI